MTGKTKKSCSLILDVVLLQMEYSQAGQLIKGQLKNWGKCGTFHSSSSQRKSVSKYGFVYIQELSFIFILNMLMRAYSFNKRKVTRSFILISFIYSLKILSKYNISPEIHLASSGNGRVISASIKPILTNYQKCNEWTACFDFVFESLLILVLSWH